jgi:hypothetical protein
VLLSLRAASSGAPARSHPGNVVMHVQDFSQTVLPVLAQLMRRLQAEGAGSEQLAVFQRVAVKIFFSCTYMSIPNCMIQDDELAREWLQVRTLPTPTPNSSAQHCRAQPCRAEPCRTPPCGAHLRGTQPCQPAAHTPGPTPRACSEAHMTAPGLQVLLAMMKQPAPTMGSADTPDLDRSPSWLLRKWLLRVALRLLQRYGDPKIVKLETARGFATLFLSEFSIPFLDVRPPSARYHACNTAVAAPHQFAALLSSRESSAACGVRTHEPF